MTFKCKQGVHGNLGTGRRSSIPRACGATMGAALLTPKRQQRPCSFSPQAVLFGAASLGPVSYRFVSYIKKPVKLNTLRELISAPEQSLLSVIPAWASNWRGSPTIPRAGTGDVDSSTSNPRNMNCFLQLLFVGTIGNESFSQAQTLFCNSTQVEHFLSL